MDNDIQISRTQQATFEAFNLLMEFSPEIYGDSCYNDYYDICILGSRLIDVCQDGLWSYEEHCSAPHVESDSTASGSWDVYCDSDGDGLPNSEDNCPTIANSDQSDTDGDCIGDVCDEFPEIYDLTQPDTDSDNIGDACDSCPNDPENDAD